MDSLTFEQKKSICDAMPNGKGYNDMADRAKVECYQAIVGQPPGLSNGEQDLVALSVSLLAIVVVAICIKWVLR